MDRLDVGQLANVVLFEPGEERACRPVIGLARVAVADRRRKEFEKAADGALAGAGDRRRDDDVAGNRRNGSRCLIVTSSFMGDSVT